MPLKPIFDKAPLMPMTSQPLSAGFVRMETTGLSKLYKMTAVTNDPVALEGTFRLACIVTAKPTEEPVAAKIKEMLATQKENGAFSGSFKESIAILRACWAMYEYEARKPLLDHIARWCAFAVQHWDELMADDDVWVFSADLLELLENLYRVTGKAAVLSLCDRLANQTMGWSSVLNTFSAQRPICKTMSKEELAEGLRKEAGNREGYYNYFYRTNHAASLADGARSTMAKGLYSGSATELNATRNGWERISRYHGAVCGGLTSDEMLEGTSPSAAVSTAALGAWAEALCAAAMTEKSDWAFDAIERMAFNAMPAAIIDDKVTAFQSVNSLRDNEVDHVCFHVSSECNEHALNRLVRGYAAVVSSCVTAREDGATINLYMPGRYAVQVDESLMILNIATSAKGAVITVHCRQEMKAAVRLRMPSWSQNTEVIINGAEYHQDVVNNLISFDRNWRDGDTISLSFDVPVKIEDGHHQGKYVLRGPVLMAMPVENHWKKAFVSAAYENNQVFAILDPVQEWTEKNGIPADIPVLPEAEMSPEAVQLMPYARTKARIAMFPRRKQA